MWGKSKKVETNYYKSPIWIFKKKRISCNYLTVREIWIFYYLSCMYNNCNVWEKARQNFLWRLNHGELPRVSIIGRKSVFNNTYLHDLIRFRWIFFLVHNLKFISCCHHNILQRPTVTRSLFYRIRVIWWDHVTIVV